jgi:miniconductance mechanosensitive channel
MMDAIKAWLVEQGLSAEHSTLIAALTAALLVILLSAVAYYITRSLLLRFVRAAAKRTATTWDDALVESKVFSRLSHVVPAVVIFSAAPRVFVDYPESASTVRTATFIYMALVGMIVIDALLNAILRIYRTFEISKRVHIQALIQVIKIVVHFFGGIAILAIVLGKSPLVFFSGLGAFAAVLMLIFKDAILGFVAGIQLMSYDMVRRGDWIEMPSHHADGDVLDVSLTTVKVQNWDKTITTIPTYALVSHSFKNWRGMSESGGRRIKRAVHIDITSIRFCDAEMLERFKRIQFITEYVERKVQEVQQYNQQHEVDESMLINGRNLTNVGTFRAYLVAYLRHHPMIHQHMTFLVRQLRPTERGLPIEIYVFSRDQAWANYEAIQADIFDHILAIIPEFDLRYFQAPTGSDLQRIPFGTVEGAS